MTQNTQVIDTLNGIPYFPLIALGIIILGMLMIIVSYLIKEKKHA